VCTGRSKKGVEELEMFQGSTTKMIKETKQLLYKERLKGKETAERDGIKI